MKKLIGFLTTFVLLWLVACEKDPPFQNNVPNHPPSPTLDQRLDSVLQITSGGIGKSFYELPESYAFHQIPQDPNNPITTDKVQLGKLLFHEPGIGTNAFEAQGTQTFSCSSCHIAAAGFQSGLAQGLAEGGEGFGVAGESRFRSKLYFDDFQIDAQPVRAPSVLNVAYQETMLWGGRMGGKGINEPFSELWEWSTAPEHFNTFELLGVETQAIGGLQIHRMEMDVAFLDSTGYKAMFDEIYPEFSEADRYQFYTAGLAVAAYLRTLLANKAPWQLWLKGNNNALSANQKEGALLFFGKAGCYNCHNSPAMNKMEFHALGMKDLDHLPIVATQTPNDADMNKGRGDFTQNPDEYYQFKVPQLYNLKDVNFLGHGASFHTVREVIAYKNAAIPENPNVPTSNLSEFFVPLNLTELEIDQLTDFIENGLYDPELDRYVPSSNLSGLCFPNNDYLSRQDLGCN